MYGTQAWVQISCFSPTAGVSPVSHSASAVDEYRSFSPSSELLVCGEPQNNWFMPSQILESHSQNQFSSLTTWRSLSPMGEKTELKWGKHNT